MPTYRNRGPVDLRLLALGRTLAPGDTVTTDVPLSHEALEAIGSSRADPDRGLIPPPSDEAPPPKEP
ncbi:MAG TPA: hypothetical protein VMW47_05425 [Verrucomicrobiae bacterium]|nr:hypothetical protein [Verrucomicrobiae bacterium]